MTTADDLRPWLGPAWGDLTPDQRDRLAVESDRIAARYPDPDDQDERDAALSIAVQYLLGETTVGDAGRALINARRELARAMAASKQIAAMAALDGSLSEVKAAEQAAIDRMTLLKVLGKR
jgi:hypothetical protein